MVQWVKGLFLLQNMNKEMCVAICSCKPFINSEDPGLETKLIHKGILNQENIKEMECSPYDIGPGALLSSGLPVNKFLHSVS